MCGLCGYISTRREADAEMTAIARRMAQRLAHRGPDDSGEWVTAESGVALSHRRLAIIDLSPLGHQPMQSASGRFVVVFNGEIYNYLEIRRDLEAADGTTAWRGSSDTEVLLAAIEQWGIEKTLPRLNGMFAFALWDRVARQLVLARDRFGEKPLYYGTSNGVFLFGSELRALTAHPAWRGELNQAAVRSFMQFKYVGGPATIYSGINKLPAAAYLKVGVDSTSGIRVGDPQTYWSPIEVAAQARQRPFTDWRQAKEEFDEVFHAAVGIRVRADVPLGAFLSGGVDSSLIVAAMRRNAGKAVKTFTIGYEEKTDDESAQARLIADHLGTEHQSIRVTAQDVRAAITTIPECYDEPFADTSQVPTYLVSRATRRHVTVALTGDGGDELFGGYHRYFVGQRTWQSIGRLPLSVRRQLSRLIRSASPASWDSLLARLTARGPLKGRLRDYSGHRLHTLANVLNARSTEELYRSLMTGSHSGVALLRDTNGRESVTAGHQWPSGFGTADAMMLVDTLEILPDDFLVKVDRAAMSVSLETRAPFLDPQLFEFAWRLPLDWKISRRQGKIFLRNVLADRIPERFIDSAKRGFGIPLEQWLRGPLREWAESLLFDRSLRDGGVFDPRAVTDAWKQYLAGASGRFPGIWSVLVFQGWLHGQHTALESRQAALPPAA